MNRRTLSPKSYLLNPNNGFGILEIVVGVGIIAMTLFGIITTVQNMLRISTDARYETKAGLLLEETIEILRAVRDNSYTELAANPHDTWLYLDTSTDDPGTWAVQSDPGLVLDRFTRRFMIHDVYRDDEDDISNEGAGGLGAGIVGDDELGGPSSPGEDSDPNTKEFVVEITWTKHGGGQTTRNATTYLTNLFND